MKPAEARAWGVHADAVELVEKRTRHAKHFVKPDGTFTAVFGKEIHYQAATGWEEIDLTFQPSGADHVMDRHDRYHARVSPGGVTIRHPATGQGVRWLTPGSHALAGRRARFSDQGLTWEYVARNSGMKLEAVVSAPVGPKTYTFRYVMLGGAQPFVVDEEGNLRSGDVIVPRATAMGADGTTVYQCAPWHVGPGKNDASFTFDDSVIPSSQYPYVLDPTTTVGMAASGDDGHVLKTKGTYPPSDVGATINNTLNITFAGRTYNAGFTVTVSLMRWNTSSLGASAIPTAAYFNPTYNTAAYYDTDNRSYAVEWYSAANWPIDALDHAMTAPGSPVITRDLTGIPLGGTETLACASLTGVDPTGYTGIRIHITGGQPTGNNQVSFYAWDHTTQPEAKLIVDYVIETPGSDLRRFLQLEHPKHTSFRGTAPF